MLDVLITGGTVVDGSGRPSFQADVGILRGRIAAMGDLRTAQGARVIDAKNRVVSPGFIDIHQHGDFTLLVNRAAESAVRQGVTTVVVGNCGHGCAPVRDPDQVKMNIAGYRSEWGVPIDWRSFGEYIERIQTPGTSVNVAPLVAHGAIRLAVMGFAARPATSDELKAMEAVLAQALDEGAVGFSTGLEYAPGKNAETQELLRLCRLVAEHGGIYASHIRNRGLQLLEATEEAITVAEQTGVPLQISHFAPRLYTPPGHWERAMEMIYASRNRGVDITIDTFPYIWGPGPIAAMLPTWVREGNAMDVLERLRDPALRARMREDADSRFALAVELGLLDRSFVVYSKGCPDCVGKSHAQLVHQSGKDPYDVILDILLAEGQDFYNVIGRGWYAHEDELRALLREPICMVESDGVILSQEGPARDFTFSISDYGWTARLLQTYVREERLLPLEEAVRRMTSLPATKVGLGDRGRLEPGMAADVVIFDLNTVADLGSLEEPRRYPAGIDYVLVNGEVTVSEGEHTGVLSGSVLRGRRG